MILFLDTLSRGGVRLPDFLKGCSGLQRVETQEGDIVTTGDPLLIQPPRDGWQDIADGWKVALVGDPELDRHLRIRSDMQFGSARDPFDRIWRVPLVLDKDENCLLPMSWAKRNGIRVREPNEEQAKLLAAATAGRGEIVADTLGTVPIDIVAEWVHALLESAYHLSGEVIDALGLMSDELAAWVLLTASGYQEVAANG